MTIAEDSRQKIEAYLSRLRKQLRGMNAADVQDIAEELRSILPKKPMQVEGLLPRRLMRCWQSWVVRTNLPASI